MNSPNSDERCGFPGAKNVFCIRECVAGMYVNIIPTINHIRLLRCGKLRAWLFTLTNQRNIYWNDIDCGLKDLNNKTIQYKTTSATFNYLLLIKIYCGIYNICTHHAYSFADIMDECADFMNCKLRQNCTL